MPYDIRRDPWWAAPLRDGEYDVPVMFRVTGDSAEAARLTVKAITDTATLIETTGHCHIVPMWTPEASVPASERALFTLVEAVEALVPLGSNGLIDTLWGHCRRIGQHHDAEAITTTTNAIRAALCDAKAALS